MAVPYSPKVSLETLLARRNQARPQCRGCPRVSRSAEYDCEMCPGGGQHYKSYCTLGKYCIPNL
jgi:hypothetical protein